MNTPNFKTKSRAAALFSTTVVLTVTTLFARTIIVYYNVYLSGKIGAVGIGVFELIMSVYAFAKTASTAGVSLAATRMSAEENKSLKSTMRRILVCCSVLGLFCAFLLCVLAKPICQKLLGDPPGGILSLKILAVSLPFLSMASGFGGFFIAKRKMRMYAPVQICEQLIRVGLTVYLLERFSKDQLSFSICSIALAITISEVVAFLFSSVFYVFVTKGQKHSDAKQSPRKFLRAFSRLAFPVGGGALFRASLNTVYNILVPHGLKKSGSTAENALAAYGTVQGMALPIILYPSAVMGAVSLQLVPEIAALKQAKSKKQLEYVATRVLRMTMLFSIVCGGMMFVFSDELSSLVFGTSEASLYIRALAFLVPVMYLDTVSDGILKGLDLQMRVLGIGIADSLLSLTLIYFLLPPFGVVGYLVTIYAGECINTLLGQIELRRHLNVRFSLLRDILLPTGCVFAAAELSKGLFLHLSTLDTTLSVVCCIFGALILCALIFIATGALNGEEIQWACTLLRSKKLREEIN